MVHGGVTGSGLRIFGFSINTWPQAYRAMCFSPHMIISYFYLFFFVRYSFCHQCVMYQFTTRRTLDFCSFPFCVFFVFWIHHNSFCWFSFEFTTLHIERLRGCYHNLLSVMWICLARYMGAVMRLGLLLLLVGNEGMYVACVGGWWCWCWEVGSCLVGWWWFVLGVVCCCRG